MRKMIFIGAITLMGFSGQSYASDYFQEWCDAFTAQELVSLAANRIYGRPSSLSDTEYEARSEWVNAAYAKAAERFKKRTGKEFSGYGFKQSGNWVSRCQTVDQIQ